ncbi:hypothetical protein F66182_1366 [Fusarium sp. NRRL 66182]|nr:hypothetical protein F66182_1366 [Fusarium sp. NRRL 66182]
MAGKGSKNTKNDSNTQDSESHDSQETTGSLSSAAGVGWRPGRTPANRDINLGLRRSQRIRERHKVVSPRRDSHTEERSQETPPVRSRRGQPERQQPVDTNSSAMSTPASIAASEPARRAQRPIPPGWKPPLAIGESLGDNLSRVEEAERLVLQWEAIVKNARIMQPRADLSGLERQLDKVTRRYKEMEECDENLIPVNELESTKRQRIQDRISLLTASLERNECPVGDINIRAAIHAYQAGRIQCWDKWTLLYAGHIADFCPSYESFTLDREERLDLYHRSYGEGWLWYEPPLAPGGNYQPAQLMAATWAQPSKECGLLTAYTPHGWQIHMGFRRVRGFHDRVTEHLGNARRLSQNGKVLLYQTRLRESDPEKRDTCFVEDDDESTPRVCFKMQLDSGATHPSLHNADLGYLGINPETYPAQTHTTAQTANSTEVVRIYEMRVDVCRHNGESLVGDNPIYPNDRRELGGIVPVMVLVESTKCQSEPLDQWCERARENGEDISEEAIAQRYKDHTESRLSGMLPFQVCYFAGAPGTSTFWFGEDRRDVLGADRMPGQLRWEWHRRPQGVQRPDDIEELNRPRVVFDHEKNGVRLFDVDSQNDPRASLLTIDDGNESRQLLMRAGETPKELYFKEPSERTITASSPASRSWSWRKRCKRS